MYKRTTFSLVLPENDKPIMLDDTCYFIGFDNLTDAKIAQKILNSELVQNFLKSIIFPDSKRSITKDILMRIDLDKVIKLIEKSKIEFKDDSFGISDWETFKEKINRKVENSNQMVLFS